jgi:general L-amino acid transport system substrate-binding protein
MLKKALVLLVAAAVLALAVAPLAAQPQLGPITQAIVDRGSLICGVNNVLPGFGTTNDAGEFSGFDTDICRAVAAAILGDANAVTFRALTAAERPTALASGEIDMLSRNTTWTLQRDTEWGATFAPTTYYDGAGFMVKTDAGVTGLEDLEGGTICTNAGTTTELQVTDAFTEAGLTFNLQTYADFDAVLAAFEADACDAVSTDQSGLISRRSTYTNPGAWTILPIVISKEPLGPVSPQSDEQFADILRWTIWGLITAEELNVTSENVNEMMGSDNVDIQRLLGQNNNNAGNYLGIANDFMVTVISSVGNYGEIFERHLAPLGVERGVNALWTNGGLIYAPPFR